MLSHLSNCLLAAVSLLGGQALYLNGDYWLARWSSKSPEEQEQVRAGGHTLGSTDCTGRRGGGVWFDPWLFDWLVVGLHVESFLPVVA